VTSSKAVDQAYDALLAFVEAAPVGSRLPAERGLAARLGVSRSTLRTAMDRLVQVGLLSVRHGSGAVVQKAGGASLALPYRELISRFPGDREQLLELRLILEPQLAALAAERRDDAEANEIAQKADAGDPDFYVAVATASRNLQATQLVAFLSSSLETTRPLGPRRHESLDLLRHQRSSVAAAIRARDSTSAQDAMAGHLRTLARLYGHATGAADGGY